MNRFDTKVARALNELKDALKANGIDIDAAPDDDEVVLPLPIKRSTYGIDAVVWLSGLRRQCARF